MRALLLILLTGQLSAQICGEVITVSNTPGDAEYYDFPLEGSITQCDKNLRYIVEMDFGDEPDCFEILIDGETVLRSAWIGANFIDDSLCLEGYLQYSRHLNNDHTIYFGQNPPGMNLQWSQKWGLLRLIIDTPSKDPVLRIYPNPNHFSRWDIYVYCKWENFIIGHIEVPTCHVPKVGRTFELTPFNCDTIIVDSVYVGDEGTEFTIYDTVYSVLTEPRNDTIFTTNVYGCRIPIRIRTFVTPIKRPFIPNAFSPNGDGINDIFEVLAGLTVYYQIFDRSGSTAYSGISPWRGRNREGGDVPPGVYVYRVKVDEILYTGTITLVR